MPDGRRVVGIPTERIEVTATGELDLRGTVGIDRDVPVGFDRITLHFEVEGAGDRGDELIEKTLLLRRATDTRAAAAHRDHVTVSAITKTANATLITPFIVKNAASRRRRSFGRTSACSYTSSVATTPTPIQ